MNKILHGAVLGLVIGGIATLLAWQQVTNGIDKGIWYFILWIVGYAVLGAILGAVLPKHK